MTRTILYILMLNGVTRIALRLTTSLVPAKKPFNDSSKSSGQSGKKNKAPLQIGVGVSGPSVNC